jgi:hypothetical protein
LKTIQIKLKEYRTTESQESMIAAASK